MSREDQDATLKRIAAQPDVRVIPVANLKSLTPEDRAAALHVGGEDKHAIKIEGGGPSAPAATGPRDRLIREADKQSELVARYRKRFDDARREYETEHHAVYGQQVRQGDDEIRRVAAAKEKADKAEAQWRAARAEMVNLEKQLQATTPAAAKPPVPPRSRGSIRHLEERTLTSLERIADTRQPTTADLRAAMPDMSASDLDFALKHLRGKGYIGGQGEQITVTSLGRNRIAQPEAFDKARRQFPRRRSREAAGHDVTPGHDQLHHFWTKDPEGLAKWVKSLHPWTSLYNHLVKHVGPLAAERMASAWFHEVLGFWPGTPHAGAVPLPRRSREGFDPHQPRDLDGKWSLVAAAAGALRQALDDAKTNDEVAAAFKAEAKKITGRDIHADFEGSDLQLAKEHSEGILQGLEKFPNASLVGVSTYGDGVTLKPHDIRTTLDKGAYAITAKHLVVQDGKMVPESIVYFNNTHSATDPAKYRATLTAAADQDHSIAHTPHGVALHEFGHVVANHDTATTRQVLESTAAHAQRAGTTPKAYIRQEISNYAAVNPTELTAEAFSDVMLNGDYASAASHDAFKLIEANYRHATGAS